MVKREYSYMRWRVIGGGAAPTTVSMSWDEYMPLVRAHPRGRAGVSERVRELCVRLRTSGDYRGSLSSATRAALKAEGLGLG